MFLRPIENFYLYYPEKLGVIPSTLDNRKLEEVFFTSVDGVVLHGVWIPHPNPQTKDAMVVFHGNAGNLSHRLDRISTWSSLPLHFFLFDYRGYGKSHGSPSEKGLYQDGTSAVSWLEKQGIPNENVVYFGESLGGAVAIETALRKPSKALILESTFTSVSDMAKHVLPFAPRSWIQQRYASDEKIGHLQTPIMIVHGELDSLVPLEMAQRLYNNAPTPKERWYIPGADHNDVYIVAGKAYPERILAFLKSIKNSHLPP